MASGSSASAADNGSRSGSGGVRGSYGDVGGGAEADGGDPDSRPASLLGEGASTPTGKRGASSAAEAGSVGDDLKMIRGIGPRNEQRLKDVGITTFRQIAEWSEADQREFSERLSFAGRIEREDWVGQARTLAEGGTTDFSKRVASGSVRSSLSRTDPRYRE